MKVKCGLKDKKWRQCCCICRYHTRVNYHCCTDPKPDKSLHPDSKCCCSVSKGWACIVEVAMDTDNPNAAIHDNWLEHSCGCEMFTKRNQKDKC